MLKNVIVIRVLQIKLLFLNYSRKLWKIRISIHFKALNDWGYKEEVINYLEKWGGEIQKLEEVTKKELLSVKTISQLRI